MLKFSIGAVSLESATLAKKPMPRSAKTVPDEVVVRPGVEALVGREDRVAHVEERRLRRRQAHRLGDERLGVSEPAGSSPVAGDQRAPQVPQRLHPDLAVGVDLGRAGHVAEVAERVAAGAGGDAAGAPGSPLSRIVVSPTWQSIGSKRVAVNTASE